MVNNLPANVGDIRHKGLIPESGRFSKIAAHSNPPEMQETWVQSLGWEDPLEKGMATHSNILAWRIPWTEELGRL